MELVGGHSFRATAAPYSITHLGRPSNIFDKGVRGPPSVGPLGCVLGASSWLYINQTPKPGATWYVWRRAFGRCTTVIILIIINFIQFLLPPPPWTVAVQIRPHS